ncbi:SRPBCC family protein [Knoellia sp. S7-12]|uniref:SRPBCC family protein n=1 Tax=Knoellia sp. S7-12 TaxID=3126698 RepID=UPI0033660CB7
MELHHEFTVPADADEVWAVLLDLERVGGCFPGATVTDASDDGFAGTVKVKLGPIALVYAGSGTFLERDPSAHRAVIEAKGKDKRGNGTAGATVTLQLSPDGDATRVSVDTDLAITGKPAQFGRGVMQDVSDKLLGQFVACIESQFDVAEPVEVPEAPDATPRPTPLPTPRPTPPVDDAIDLGAVALPSAVKEWGPYAVAGLIGALIGYAIGRDHS